jgi:undecaprenyl-diphosphatase
MLLAYGGSSIDGSLYRAVNGLAERSPAWLDSAVSFFSTYGLALFAALMVAAWWRARAAATHSRTAMALAAPVVVVVAFLADDALKSVIREHRPCQTLHTVTLEACPAPGDWSFPSNHAAIAAAAAVAVLFIDRKLAAIAVPAAILMAVSRVWVGAHYPHDAAMGLLVGGAVAWLLMTEARRAAPLVERLSQTRLRPLVAPR